MSNVECIFFVGLCSQEEERLVRDLFRGYNKLIRPVQNMTEKVDVAFGLAFIQLINVVSKELIHEFSIFCMIALYIGLVRFFEYTPKFICTCFLFIERKESDHEK